MYSPGYITSNALRFLDHEWIDLPALKLFLDTPAASDVTTSMHPDLSPADRRLLDSLSVREVFDFRSYVCSLVLFHAKADLGTNARFIPPLTSHVMHTNSSTSNGLIPNF